MCELKMCSGNCGKCNKHTKENLQARLDACRRDYQAQQQIENARDFRENLDYKPTIRKLLSLAEDLLSEFPDD